MKERPILFSAPMVRAILEGRKTQTRRVVKPQPVYVLKSRGICSSTPDWSNIIKCPYGQPGDRLWVRETHAIVPRTAYAHSEGVHQILRPNDDHDAAIYHEGWERSQGGIRWRPSIHMPRWASRITLEITDVRVERLQEISYEDALAEGVSDMSALLHDDWQPLNGESGNECARRLRWPQRLYKQLWESINGPDSWDKNPWVWVVEFRRIDQ